MDGIAKSRQDMNIKVAAYTVTHLPNYIVANMEITDEDKGPVGDDGVDRDYDVWH